MDADAAVTGPCRRSGVAETPHGPGRPPHRRVDAAERGGSRRITLVRTGKIDRVRRGGRTGNRLLTEPVRRSQTERERRRSPAMQSTPHAAAVAGSGMESTPRSSKLAASLIAPMANPPLAKVVKRGSVWL